MAKRSSRANRGCFDVDHKAQGEKYKAPKDEVLQMQRTRALEEPGVLAGFSHHSNLPILSGGHAIHWKGYAYVHLQRRLDTDRLFRAFLESHSFEAWPWGCGPKKDDGNQIVYKETPWTHMNCCAHGRKSGKRGELVPRIIK